MRTFWILLKKELRGFFVSPVAYIVIALIMVHVYAAIWVKGTIRAMWYGTVTRAWAKQHHRGWYRQVTGK